MALTGTELVEIRKVSATGSPASIATQATTQEIADLASPSSTVTFPGIGATAALLGDSITAQNTSVSSTQVNYSSKGYANWWKNLSGQRFYLPVANNFGVSGNKLSDMAVRVPDIIAANPSFLMGLGGTNDVSNNIAYSTMESVFIEEIVKPVTDAGIPIFWYLILPRTGLSATQEKIRARFNNLVLRLGYNDPVLLENYDITPNMFFAINANIYMTDFTTGAPITEMFEDGLHPNMLGAYWMGYAAHVNYTQFLPPRYDMFNDFYDIYDATNNPTGNHVTNLTVNYGLCQGTGGAKTVASGVTPTGDVATGHRIFCSLISGSPVPTLVGSKESPRTDTPYSSGELQIVDFTASVSGGSQESFVFSPSSPQTFVTGDRIVASAKYELMDTPTPFNINGIALEFVDAGTNGTGCADGAVVPAAVTNFNVPHVGTLMTPPITITSATPNISLYCRGYCNTQISPFGAEAKIKWGDVRLYKLPS